MGVKKSKDKKRKDIEKSFSVEQTAAMLHRLADCLQQKKPFRVQISKQRIYIPPDADFIIEYEQEGARKEVEFQIQWGNQSHQKSANA